MSNRSYLRTLLARHSDSAPSDVGGRISVRTRLLAIVLISSVTLLAIGVGAAAYLVQSGREAQRWAELASSTTTPAILMVTAFEEERRLSVLHLAGDAEATGGLAAARQRSNEALAAVMAKGDAAREMNPEGSASDIEGYNVLFNAVPALRGQIDGRQTPPDEVFGFFSKVIETIIAASMLAARVAPNAGVAIELGYGVEPLRAAEALSKADTLGSVALTLNELPPERMHQINRYVGEFRGEAEYSAAVLKGTRLAELTAITDSPAWHQITAMQDAIASRGPITGGETERSSGSSSGSRTTRTAEPEPLPASIPDWQNSTAQVRSALLKLWEDQSGDAHVIARKQGDDTATRSLLGGLGVLLITVLAFVAALVLANRFIRRMRRLRADTLDIADRGLPEIMRRLGEGEQIDAADVSRLNFGTDELGQVADAFNRAHVAAVSATVGEASTRAGANAVFLNIAHRSQVVVHRQLTLLDQAERKEEDADQLELLFQLDHLATRARRNAENLIILGGEQPGRRWRDPVLLLDLIRSAVAESLEYTRIQTGRVPDVWIASHAVADSIHLLAELMDNATAFSPPQSRVEVSATVVGKGVVVEIIDQGLGIPEDDLAQRNAMLADPPDFSVAALSDDTRLGLFVVAKLSTRHGISVRLTESVYGGVRAVVLVPSTVIASAPKPRGEDAPVTPHAEPAHHTAPVRHTGPLGTAPSADPVDTPPPAGHRSAWFTSASDLRNDPAPTNPGMSRPAVSSAPAATGDTRPPLPRRRRQAAAGAPAERPERPATHQAPRRRTSADARDLMSAIEAGTRQGRQARDESGSTTTEFTRREGEDDYFQSH
ncbi:nitrate- and nitrite sensing domain-containing protein [Nocardia sp. BMG51109]|uniref:sensor histidine kinase n=1 Tax=Nocardia sp. BMG51109 TaxID=1056816 RepID=UPI00046700F0|nr:nitrate- and nitrite sensing domain-containing protein [Nocardia sp. BMG51109]